VLKTLSIIPRFIIFFLLIFTPLARGGVQGWAVTVVHIAVLLALTAFLLEKSLVWKWRWISTPLDKPIIALVVLCTLSTIFSLNFQTSFWAMVLLIDYIIVFYLVIHLFRTRSEIRQLISVIVGVAAFLAVFGLFKVSGNNPFPWWHYPEIEQHTGRMTSTYGNANHLAGYMEMTIPLLLGLFLMKPRGLKRFIWVCLSALFFTALALTFSRGGWVGSFMSLIFMISFLFYLPTIRKKKVVAITVAGILLVGILILDSPEVVQRIHTLTQPSDVPNFSARVRIWGGMLEMIKDYPVLGIGPGNFATVFTQYQPTGYMSRYFYGHNDYLHFTSELGLFLPIVMAWMIYQSFWRGLIKLRYSSRFVMGSTVGAMAGIIAILVHSITDFNLHIPANAILFCVLAALVTSPVPQDNALSLGKGIRQD
jgi:putative inorganic carbon (hco3(-)) transporter